VDNKDEKLKEVIQTSNWIIIPMIIAGSMIWFYISDHIDSLRLINRHIVTQGTIIEAKEDAEKGDDAITRFYWDVVYKFKTADGREVKDSQSDSGRVPDELFTDAEVQIEYFPESPTISRIKGFGIETLDQWLKHTWLLWFISLAYTICFLLAVRYLSRLWEQHSLFSILKRVGLACAIPLSFLFSINLSFFGFDGRIWLLAIPIIVIFYILEARYQQS
jgi:hypothetical protein